MITTGIDITEIAPFARMLERHGDRFLDRIYTGRERQLCGRRATMLACLFAAKEGVAKALGTGLNYMADAGADLREMEIIADERGRWAKVHLHGTAQARAAEIGLHGWSVSLAHSRTIALAMVVALQGPGSLPDNRGC